MWHSGSSTWFDRSTDLRVLLNGGAAPAEGAGDPNAKYAEGDAASARRASRPRYGHAAPATGSTATDSRERHGLWPRLSTTISTATSKTVDFQMGIDIGKRGLLSDNDILVFGVLGGFVHADLDYDADQSRLRLSGRPGRRLRHLSQGRAVRRHAGQRPSHADRHQDARLPRLAQPHQCRRAHRYRLPLRLVPVAARSSSLWPRSRSTGPTSTASASAATRSRSTTIPMSEDASACASAPPRKCGPASPPSRSSSAACGATSPATIRRR